MPASQRIQLELDCDQSLTLHRLKSLIIMNLPGLWLNKGSMLLCMITSRSKNKMLPFSGMSGLNIHNLLHHVFIHGCWGNRIIFISGLSPLGSSVMQWNSKVTVVCLLIMLYSTFAYCEVYLLPHLTHTTLFISSFQSFHLYLLPIVAFQCIRIFTLYSAE